MSDNTPKKLGRPTDYSEEVLERLKEYYSMCGREQTELPTVEGFANFIDVDPDTIGNWGDKHPDFFGAIKKLKSRQKNQLINDGLYGGKEVNQAMAIFLLKANHGLKETSVTELTGKDGIPLLETLKDVRNNDSTQETKGTE